MRINFYAKDLEWNGYWLFRVHQGHEIIFPLKRSQWSNLTVPKNRQKSGIHPGDLTLRYGGWVIAFLLGIRALGQTFSDG